jgi:hypothetical protein
MKLQNPTRSRPATFQEKKQVSANIHRSQKPVSPSSAVPSKINLGDYDTNFFFRLATPSPAGASRPQRLRRLTD